MAAGRHSVTTVLPEAADVFVMAPVMKLFRVSKKPDGWVTSIVYVSWNSSALQLGPEGDSDGNPEGDTDGNLEGDTDGNLEGDSGGNVVTGAWVGAVTSTGGGVGVGDVGLQLHGSPGAVAAAVCNRKHSDRVNIPPRPSWSHWEQILPPIAAFEKLGVPSKHTLQNTVSSPSLTILAAAASTASTAALPSSSAAASAVSSWHPQVVIANAFARGHWSSVRLVFVLIHVREKWSMKKTDRHGKRDGKTSEVIDYNFTRRKKTNKTKHNSPSTESKWL
jgi:hypothetical protein